MRCEESERSEWGEGGGVSGRRGGARVGRDRDALWRSSSTGWSAASVEQGRVAVLEVDGLLSEAVVVGDQGRVVLLARVSGEEGGADVVLPRHGASCAPVEGRGRELDDSEVGTSLHRYNRNFFPHLI